MQHEIVGMGRICVDHVVCLDDYPARDTKNHIKEHWFQVGGPVPTALVTARRLGDWSASFMGQWGDDTHGEWIRADLAREGVDASRSRAGDASRTAFAHIWVDGSGARTIAYARGRFESF
jgi:sugar/nucleoside kinase (ribokinase family)